ncbi:MAG: ABC transporter ATP-binding protein, partial [Pseudolabrys sp.]
MSTLSIRGLRSGYGKIEVLHDVTLDVARGQIVTLIGANGAGKTTLLKTISGLLRPSAGSITFEGKSIVRRPPHKIVELGISHVPEGRAILKRMTVIDNLRMGAYVRTDSEIAEDIEAALVRFPLLSERRLQIAGTLSGGEQQMLAIGRALVARPRLLLFDEPSLGLAPKIVSQIFLTLRELKNEGKTILLVEQNARQALRVADHGCVLERGRIIYSGSGEELLNMPEVQRT